MGDEFGADLAFLGEVDGDGLPEVAIGSGRDETTGTIRVFSLEIGPQVSGSSLIPNRPMGVR